MANRRKTPDRNGESGPAAPDSVSSMLIQAQHHLQSGRLDDAETVLRRALSAAPRNVDALMNCAILAHQRGRSAEARGHLSVALDVDNGNPFLHHIMGEIEAADGNPAAAVASFDRALTRDANLPDSLFSRGNALAELGRRDDAIESFRQAVALAPRDAEAHLNLADLLSEMDQGEAALHHIETALTLQPDFLAAQVALAAHHLGSGAHPIAIEAYDAILARHPDLFEALLGRGRAALRSGKFEEAKQFLAAAHAQRPAVMPLLLDLGEVGLRLGHFDEARRRFEDAHRLDPESIIARVRLGAALRECDRLPEAKAHLEEALRREPDNAEAHCQMGVMLQRSGEFAAAVPYLGRAIEIDPRQTGPYSALAADRGRPVSDEVRERMQALVGEEDLRRDDRAELHFALGHIHDGAGDYDAAFAHFRAGNAIRDRDVPFDIALFGRFIDATCDVFTSALFDAAPSSGIDSELPVFVVGMPRSGTTLVEQIVAAHADAAGAGELSTIGEIAGGFEGAKPYPLSVADLDGETLASAGARYLDVLGSAAPGKRRVVDKMPNNFTHLGLIALMLPRARVVHCRRDPMDTALSCYLHNFGVGVRFSYDLEKIATYYRHYERVMAHWRKVLPLPVLDLQYEDLVADPEAQSRRLIEFVGLPWDDACLDFHSGGRPVKTASLWQVRQPVYRSSIGRWRNYEKHLAQLRHALDDGGTPDRPAATPTGSVA
ncbi:MAG: tetratricopeptide repeat protein [Alphaproteobacteria bacterium]|nr:tetratricopeptide repeat protein [Alphaproteobacteria bacterium]